MFVDSAIYKLVNGRSRRNNGNTSVPKKKAPTPPTRRRRLSADEAREAILAATEKRLREVGPDALRLQEIAQDVGLSHPTVLHHIGSREALVAAVVQRSMLALEDDLIACFTGGAMPMDIASTLHQIDEVMRVKGQARLVAWLALTQAGTVKKESRLREVALALHAARSALSKKDAPFEDTAFGALLASVATFGLAILGPGLLEMLGLPSDEATQRRFREWFAALLMEHGGIPLTPGSSSSR
jgi:AcrR family transcriptional regulator